MSPNVEDALLERPTAAVCGLDIPPILDGVDVVGVDVAPPPILVGVDAAVFAFCFSNWSSCILSSVTSAYIFTISAARLSSTCFATFC